MSRPCGPIGRQTPVLDGRNRHFSQMPRDFINRILREQSWCWEWASERLCSKSFPPLYSSSSSSTRSKRPSLAFSSHLGSPSWESIGMLWDRLSCSILAFSSLDSSSNSFSDLENSSPAGLSGSGPAMFAPLDEMPLRHKARANEQ